MQKTCSKINTCRLACEACKNQSTHTKEDLKSLYDTFIIDDNDNLVLSSSKSDYPSTKIKFTIGGKGHYEEGGRIIEFLYPSDIKRDFSDDLMNTRLNNTANPYDSLARPSVRFYNFARNVTGECAITLRRFAIIKDENKKVCSLLDDVDCQHFNEWPINVLYYLATPSIYFKESRDFFNYSLMRAFMADFKIRHCFLCDHCHTSEGGCMRYGDYMSILLHVDNIDKFKESMSCKRYSVNRQGLQFYIKHHPVPLIEWKK